MSDALTDFVALFGAAPTVRAEAPGRVNLLGEHTDYNGGAVLPVAIAQTTEVELRPRDSNVVRVFSERAPEARVERFTLGEEKRTGHWWDYVAGTTAALRAEGFSIRGFDLRVTSRVPLGSGLSSSASLDVAVLRALRQSFSLALDDVRLALIAQRAENDLVGAPVGVMDPMAASLADDRSALFLDTRSLAYERVALPAGAGLVVIHSGISHQHAHGGYRARRDECARAAAMLGVSLLCELGLDDLDRVAELPAPLDRRARHVLTENARVYEGVAAMRHGDLARLGALFDASHASMRDDYEVSVPEIDLLVSLTSSLPGVYGARLTGGGFGGSIVALTEGLKSAEVARAASASYASHTGLAPVVLVPSEESR